MIPIAEISELAEIVGAEWKALKAGHERQIVAADRETVAVIELARSHRFTWSQTAEVFRYGGLAADADWAAITRAGKALQIWYSQKVKDLASLDSVPASTVEVV